MTQLRQNKQDAGTANTELLKVAVLHRVVSQYRLGFFQKLSQSPRLRVKFLVGESLPDGKIRNANDFGTPDVQMLPTKWLRILGTLLPSEAGTHDVAAALKLVAPAACPPEGAGLLSGHGHDELAAREDGL